MNSIDDLLDVSTLFFKWANDFSTWLFGIDGIHLIQWYFALIVIDVILGVVNSFMKGKVRSRTYLKGIMIKMLAVFGVVLSAFMDYVFRDIIHINIGTTMVIIYTGALCVYEAGSIVETLYVMGALPKKLRDILSRGLAVANDKVDKNTSKMNDKNDDIKDDKENK